MRVFGAFSDYTQAQRAVESLLAGGFDNHHVSYVESMVGLRLDSERVTRYTSHIAAGGAVLCVYCDEPGSCPKAKSMLSHAGAIDVHCCHEASGEKDIGMPAASAGS